MKKYGGKKELIKSCNLDEAQIKEKTLVLQEILEFSRKHKISILEIVTLENIISVND